MGYCQVNSLLVKYDPGIKINPLRCKRWACADCRPLRHSRLKKEARRGSPNTFITLTVNPAWGNDRDHRARALVEAWRRTRRKAQDHWGNRTIPFLAVFEETENGEPHLHIIARSSWIPQRWLSDQIKAEIQAPIVNISRIKSQRQVSRYVAKYISKAPEKYPGTKRYWRSLDYFVKEKEQFDPQDGRIGKPWFAFGTPEEIAKEWEIIGYEKEFFYWKDGAEYWIRPPTQKVREEPRVIQTELPLSGIRLPQVFTSGERG